MKSIIDALIHQQLFEEAEHFIGVCQERTGSLHLQMLRAMGIALAVQDRQEDACEVFSVAIAACDAALDENPPTLETWRGMDDAECRRQVELYAFRARLEHEAGQSAGAISTYEILYTAVSALGIQFPDHGVTNTAARLADLRALINGRDLVLLCEGHSLGAFAARLAAQGSRTPAMASLNRFGVVDAGCLGPCPPQALYRHRNELDGRGAQSQTPQTILTAGATDDRDRLAERVGRRVQSRRTRGICYRQRSPVDHCRIQLAP